MKRTRSKSKAVPGARHPTFKAWLKGRTQIAADAGCLLTKMRCIRTSGSDVEKWQASAITSFAAVERHKDPDVVEATAHGMDLVRRDRAGEDKRAALGDAVFVLRMCHAPGGVGTRQLGIVLHVGSTLFVYLLASARADDLEADDDDRRGNAATEILSTTVREVFAGGRAHDRTFRPEVHAREHERIVRSENHGTTLKRTLIACHVIAYTPHRIDLLNPAEAQSFSFGTLISAGAVAALVKGMNRAEIVMLSNGGYYSSIGQVPFTHEAASTEELDLGSGAKYTLVNKHRLVVARDVDAARKTLRAIVDVLLQDRLNLHGIPEKLPDWNRAAGLPEVQALPSRLPADLKRGITLGQKPISSRVQGLKSLFSARWIKGLRTGWTPIEAPVKAAMDLDLGDKAELIERDGRSYYKCSVAMPLPEGGWGITDPEWDELLRRRYPGRKGSPTDDCHPLTGITWDDPESNREGRLHTHSRYLVQTRRLSEARSERGGRIGWHNGPDVTHEATITSAGLHRSVAEAARNALLSLECKTAPMVLRRGRPTQTEDASALHEREAARLALAVEEADDELQGAEVARNRAEGAALRARNAGAPDERLERTLARALNAVTLAEDSLQLAEQAKAAHQAGAEARPAPTAQETADVLTATPEFVVAALEKCAGVAPLWLNAACVSMFTDWRFNVVREEATRHVVQWQCSLVIEVLGEDEEPVALSLTGEVKSSANGLGDCPSTTPEDWAWRFFYRGESMAQVGEAAGIDGSGKKNSYLYKSLTQWLEPAVPDATLRNAAVTCPIPAMRRVLWTLVTGDQDAVRGIDEGYVRHIARMYGAPAWKPSWTWCRDTHVLGRAIANSLRTAPDARLPLHALLADLKVSKEALLSTARENGATTSGQGERTTPATNVAYFLKSFRRGVPTVAPDDRRMMLRPCPHRDCPARQAGRQGYATVVINVPETEQWHGVLCPDCMRTPDAAAVTVRFPADYARPWCGRYGVGSSGNRKRSGTDPVYLDPNVSDSGPPPKLQQQESVARIAPPKSAQPQVVSNPGAGPLMGSRVLELDLDQAQRAAFTARTTALGGVVGYRVKLSLAALVVPDEHGRLSAKAVRAAGLGIPVLTLEDYDTWVPATEPGEEGATGT